MLIKLENGYLDFNDFIEVEKKVKVFSEIETIDGDFSYSFELQPTAHNLSLLGNPQPDTIKSFTKIKADLFNDSGISIYKGYIRVERIGLTISCSFFAGNSEWFSSITGNLSDLTSDIKDYTYASVITTWNDTSKWFFPYANYGTWDNRSNFTVNLEDFHPWYYVKDLVAKILSDSAIKLRGDLLNDWRYNHLILTSGIKQQERINQYTEGVDQTVSTAVTEAGGPETLDSYILADYAVYIRVRATIQMTGASTDVVRLGLSCSTSVAGISNSFKTEYDGQPLSIDYAVLLPAGATLNVFAEVLNTGGSITVTHVKTEFVPEFIYSFKLSEILPEWSKVDLLVNVFKLFNCVVTYEQETSTITANLFDKIKSKPAIDLSDYLHSSEADISEFVSSYGKKTNLVYTSSSLNDYYNKINSIPYGGGQLTVNNDYIEPETDAVESDFIPPKRGTIRALGGGGFEIFDLAELEEIQTNEITSVTDNSGVARLNMASSSGFIIGQIVRIELDNDAYNGDWIVEVVGAGYIECFGLGYIANSTGDVNILRTIHSDTDDAFLALAVANINPLDVSPIPFVGINIGYCYFNLLRTGRNIDEYRKSLSFGDTTLEGDYQQKMKEDYYNLFEKALNDPVMLPCEMFLPESVFKSLDFQQPVTLKSISTSNMYFLNRITGYEKSSVPCEVELIKL